MSLSPDQVAAYVTAGVFAVLVALEKWKTHKNVQKTEVDEETLSLAKASRDRADLLAKILDETKLLLTQERTEHKNTRDFWHDENGKAQKLISEANLKVLELQDRPDLRDLLSEMKVQGNALNTLGNGIEEILRYIQKTL